MLKLLPATDLRVRAPRVVVGLILFGSGIAFMVAADLGLGPWSVLDQGLSRRAGLSIGTVTILTSIVVLVAWIPLRERPGLGTLLNVMLVGLTTDVVLLVLETPETTSMQLVYLAIGVFLFGPGSGYYIGAGLGPGPRDGLMTGLVRRGMGSVRLVRTVLELSVLVVGWLLGGTVGVGTVVFALTIGPNVQFFLGRLTVPGAQLVAAAARAQEREREPGRDGQASEPGPHRRPR